MHREIKHALYLLSKYLGSLFPLLLRRSLEATSFKIFPTIVGSFTMDFLSSNWSKFFQHNMINGSIAGNAISSKAHNQKHEAQNSVVLLP